MTYPDGRKIIIALSQSQSCHLRSFIASISDATPSLRTNRAVLLSIGPPSDLSMIRHAWLWLPSVFSKLYSAWVVATFQWAKKKKKRGRGRGKYTLRFSAENQMNCQTLIPWEQATKSVISRHMCMAPTPIFFVSFNACHVWNELSGHQEHLW